MRTNKPQGSRAVWLWHSHLARDSRAGRPCHSDQLYMTRMTRSHRKSIRTAVVGLALLGSLLALLRNARAEPANSPLPPPKAVARGWGIGSSEGEKNGLLLLVAADDRKYHIQVSRHLEGDLPDGLVGEVGRRMRDPFRKSDYSGGLMTAVQTIVSTLEEKRGFSVADVDKKYSYRPSAEPVRETSRGISPCVLFLIVIFVIIFAISSRRRGGRGGFGGGGGWLNWLLLSMVLNSGNRGW